MTEFFFLFKNDIGVDMAGPFPTDEERCKEAKRAWIGEGGETTDEMYFIDHNVDGYSAFFPNAWDYRPYSQLRKYEREDLEDTFDEEEIAKLKALDVELEAEHDRAG